MTVRSVVAIIVTLAAITHHAAAATATSDPGSDTGQSPPNVLIFFADDAGYADFDFQDEVDPNARGLTPNIATIAKNGVRLTNAYVSGCVCSPSCAGLMTGRYQQRFGHEQNIPPGYMQGGMSLDEQTIADRLGTLGYATALIGKWHLGYPDDYHPNERGFDYFYGCLQGSRGYFPYEKPTPHRVILENRTPTPEVGYVTDRFGHAAARFIEEHVEEKPDEPFFLFLSFTAPHGPNQAKKEDLEALAKIKPVKRRKHLGLVKAMDDNIGRVLETVRRLGILEDTIIVFTNDNGGQTRTGANNGTLRGRKGTLWEGGIRVPMAIQWTGTIRAGTVVDDPVITLDFIPTLVATAGGTVEPECELDGIDVMPRLKGEVDSLSERPLFWRAGGSSGKRAMRLGDFKLIRDETDHEVYELYNLRSDGSETTDIHEDEPSQAETMLRMLEAWNRGLIEPLWGLGGR